MDPLSALPVRFHHGGEFSFNSGRITGYVGGTESMSYIDKDFVSYFEILGHAKDHCNLGPVCLRVSHAFWRADAGNGNNPAERFVFLTCFSAAALICL